MEPVCDAGKSADADDADDQDGGRPERETREVDMRGSLHGPITTR